MEQVNFSRRFVPAENLSVMIINVTLANIFRNIIFQQAILLLSKLWPSG